MILALDLATRTGWCAGRGDDVPTVGHVDLPPPVSGDRGPLFSRFRSWLLSQIDRLNPTAVVFEQPILPVPFIKNGRVIYPTTLETTLILQGLAAIAELEVTDAGIACRNVPVAVVKKELAGRGDADKADMLRAAAKVGLECACDDEADAFGVWLVAVRYLAKQFSPDWDRRLWSSRGALI